MWTRTIERPVFRYIIVVVFSTLAAWLFFQVGGSFAEISGQEGSFLGLGFKASGAVAGFILIFWLSVRVLERLTETALRASMKVHLSGRPENFDRKDQSYVAKYRLYDADRGPQGWKPVAPRWEAGFLTLDILELVGPEDMVQLRVENSQKKIWESDYFSLRSRKEEIPILNPQQ